MTTKPNNTFGEFITMDELIDLLCENDPEFRKNLEEERILLREELAKIKRDDGN